MAGRDGSARSLFRLVPVLPRKGNDALFDIMMLSRYVLMREDDSLDRGFAFAKGEEDCS
jgi:hypothetical protein